MSVGKRKRFQVFTRDAFRCRYCGARAPEVQLSVDHVTPRCKGGGDDLDNLLTACFECNVGKGTMGVRGPLKGFRERRKMAAYALRLRSAASDLISVLDWTSLDEDQWEAFRRLEHLINEGW